MLLTYRIYLDKWEDNNEIVTSVDIYSAATATIVVRRQQQRTFIDFVSLTVDASVDGFCSNMSSIMPHSFISENITFQHFLLGNKPK